MDMQTHSHPSYLKQKYDNEAYFSEFNELLDAYNKFVVTEAEFVASCILKKILLKSAFQRYIVIYSTPWTMAWRYLQRFITSNNIS